MYLGGVVPTDVPNPLSLAKTAQTTLERTFAACEADAACHTAFLALRQEFRQILARLDSGRVHVPLWGAPLRSGWAAVASRSEFG